MLIEAYREALLVDEELADLVWELWNQGEIGDLLACLAWLLVAAPTSVPDTWLQVSLDVRRQSETTTN